MQLVVGCNVEVDHINETPEDGEVEAPQPPWWKVVVQFVDAVIVVIEENVLLVFDVNVVPHHLVGALAKPTLARRWLNAELGLQHVEGTVD